MLWVSRSNLTTTSTLQSFLILRSSWIPTCFLLFGQFQLLLQIPQVSDFHARQHGTKTKKNRGMYRMLHCFCRFCWRISLNSWFIMCFCMCLWWYTAREFKCEYCNSTILWILRLWNTQLPKKSTVQTISSQKFSLLIDCLFGIMNSPKRWEVQVQQLWWQRQYVYTYIYMYILYIYVCVCVFLDTYIYYIYHIYIIFILLYVFMLYQFMSYIYVRRYT